MYCENCLFDTLFLLWKKPVLTYTECFSFWFWNPRENLIWVFCIVIFEFQQAFKSVLLFHKVNSFVKQNNKLGITVCILKRFEVHILKESSLLKYWILVKNYNLYSMNHNKNNKRFINWDTFILGFVELVCIY